MDQWGLQPKQSVSGIPIIIIITEIPVILPFKPVISAKGYEKVDK